MFDIQDVEFSFAPTSLLSGSLKVDKITTGPIGVIGNITGSGSRIRNLVIRVRAELVKGMKLDSNKQITVETIRIGKGIMKVGPALIGSSVEKEINFPATTLKGHSPNDAAFTQLRLAQRVIFAIGQSALKATVFRVPMLKNRGVKSFF